MAIGIKKLQANLERIRQQCAEAALRVRRDPANVTIVAVTKSAEMEDILHLLELGVTDLGESRVQQFSERAEEVASLMAERKAAGPIRWHMIGHLQRNKVKAVLEHASLVHSVDSLRLAEEISLRSEQMGRTSDVLLEVNCSREEQKFGVAVGAATHMVEQICTLKGVRLIGLMTMAARSDNPEQARVTFVRLREIFEEMRTERIGGKNLRHLSMGMSQDFVPAIEEGATLVRIGTSLFT